MKVLLGVDGSGYSQLALDALKALAPPSLTEVTVITVVAERAFLGGITFPVFWENASPREQERKERLLQADGLVQEVAEALRASGFRADCSVSWGKPASEIIEKASEMQADLIVIGAKGLNDAVQFPLGAIAPKIVAYAGCAVLLARGRIQEAGHVLVGADGSPYSDAAVGFLLDLPLPLNHHVVVATALESHTSSLTAIPTMNIGSHRRRVAELRAAEEKAARALHDKTRKQFEARGYNVSCEVLKGDPAEAILAAADELPASLVVLGAKGLTGIDSWLLGNVAQRVARFAKCSVLIGR